VCKIQSVGDVGRCCVPPSLAPFRSSDPHPWPQATLPLHSRYEDRYCSHSLSVGRRECSPGHPRLVTVAATCMAGYLQPGDEDCWEGFTREKLGSIDSTWESSRSTNPNKDGEEVYGASLPCTEQRRDRLPLLFCPVFFFLSLPPKVVAAHRQRVLMVAHKRQQDQPR
jgi:hypothetical protein